MNQEKQITVAFDFQEARKDPDMQLAMEAEIQYIRTMGCIGEVSLPSLSTTGTR